MYIVVFGYSDQKNLNDYRRLKYWIFVEEYGWPLHSDESDKTLIVDKYDLYSIFFGCYEHGTLVGVCRCSFASGDYPHQELLQSYINDSEFLLSEYAVLTSYAFLNEFRGKIFSTNEEGHSYTYANALFLFIVDHLRSKGIRRILLSAGVGGSEKAFERWGFKPVSGEIYLEGAPNTVRNYAYEIR